ncbi:MAG: DUF2892 domain-containing protein [Phycisphaerales bacterium]|nr:MAG: DUF2892 domain-containing protein [Phycisphaerales bacterium]
MSAASTDLDTGAGERGVPGGGVSGVEASVVAGWLAAGKAALIDVREDFEHAEERIEGATSMPLSSLDASAVREMGAGGRVVFHCRSGKRSAQAAERFAATGEHALHMLGGIEAWKSAGLATVKPGGRRRVSIMRQVQIVAGSLVVLGVVLGVLVSGWFLAIAGFVGAGLVFAGASGWCGMAVLLGRMPWNKA